MNDCRYIYSYVDEWRGSWKKNVCFDWMSFVYVVCACERVHGYSKLFTWIELKKPWRRKTKKNEYFFRLFVCILLICRWVSAESWVANISLTNIKSHVRCHWTDTTAVSDAKPFQTFLCVCVKRLESRKTTGQYMAGNTMIDTYLWAQKEKNMVILLLTSLRRMRTRNTTQFSNFCWTLFHV